MSVVFNKISIIGLGYIGLPTAALIAAVGKKVIGVDINNEVVHKINNGHVHIVEPDLQDLVEKTIKSGHLTAVNIPQEADVFIITVPTPFTENYIPDMSYVYSAADAIAPMLKKGNLIILESTSPVGTTELLSKHLATLRTDLFFPHQHPDHMDVNIAYCPERVMPGKIIKELIENNRIIGGMTQHCANSALNLYKIFVRGECIITDSRTAEMTKLTENAFRDVNIAYANELSIICDKLKIDVWELIKLANYHPRVNILSPGPGVGGHCIAVDPWFIVHAAPNESQLIRTARKVNDSKPDFIIKKIDAAAAGFSMPTIALFGLAYKPNTNDLRESPAVEILRKLAEKSLNYNLMVVEPHINELPLELKFNHQIKLVTANQALMDADIILLLVKHDEFQSLDESKMAEKIVINTVSNKKYNKKTLVKYRKKIEEIKCIA